jgi:uncharacterized membrane protein
MTTKKSLYIIILLCLVALATSAWLYPLLPSQIASHWNIDGQVNVYMGKFWGVFLVPLIMIFLAALFQVLPRLDPTHHNPAELRQQLNSFTMVLVLFLLLIHGLVLAWNLGYEIAFGVVLPVFMGGLFYYLGELCLHVKRNWFVGVRTPWTLSSDAVWDATNQHAGKLFKACGIIAILSALIPQYSLWFVIIPLLATATYAVVYSYVEYKKTLH